MGKAVVSLSRVCVAALFGLLPAGLARASGPVERIAQVITHPTDPNIVIARYGLPDSNKGTGLLFSSDGGKTFKASCADFVQMGFAMSSSESLYKSQVHMDGAGNLIASSFIDEVFVGDATGCNFAKEPGFEIKRGASLAGDPTDPKATYMLVFTRDDKLPDAKARSQIMRRDASGMWTTVAEIVKDPAPNEQIYGSDLIVTRLPSGAVRMAVHYTIYVPDAMPPDQFHVATSDDGGQTFTAHPLTLTDNAKFRLLGFDPENPDRMIALEYGENRKDKLLLSMDGGATFQPWTEVDEFSGMTFGDGGKVYITSTIDKIDGSVGGLFVADKVGDPLTKLPDSPNLDCVHYRASDKKLFGCYLDRLGTLDAQSGAFTLVTRLQKIEELLECPGKDVKASCEKQLNSGSAWCCVGHFPWTPFCGDYSFPSRSTPICGKEAQEYVCREIGDCGDDAPPATSDGGMSTVDAGDVSSNRDAGGAEPDAGSSAAKPDAATGGTDDGSSNIDEENGPKSGGDGCSLNDDATGRAPLSTLALFGLLLAARRMRRRTRA